MSDLIAELRRRLASAEEHADYLDEIDYRESSARDSAYDDVTELRALLQAEIEKVNPKPVPPKIVLRCSSCGSETTDENEWTCYCRLTSTIMVAALPLAILVAFVGVMLQKCGVL